MDKETLLSFEQLPSSTSREYVCSKRRNEINK